MSQPLCPCGQPLHYATPLARQYTEAIITNKGELITVTVEGESWLVPRRYIALHGFKGYEVAGLAEKYGWEKVFSCPRCGRVSHNPHDIEAGYCGACHDWTGRAQAL